MQGLSVRNQRQREPTAAACSECTGVGVPRGVNPYSHSVQAAPCCPTLQVQTPVAGLHRPRPPHSSPGEPLAGAAVATGQVPVLEQSRGHATALPGLASPVSQTSLSHKGA